MTTYFRKHMILIQALVKVLKIQTLENEIKYSFNKSDMYFDISN